MSSYPGVPTEYLGSSYRDRPTHTPTPAYIANYASINKPPSSEDTHSSGGSAGVESVDPFLAPMVEPKATYNTAPSHLKGTNTSQSSPETKKKPTLRSRLFWAVKAFPVLVYSICFIATGAAQVLAFKKLGYALGPYPYFILITVSFAFVPILFVALAYIRLQSGGFLPETTTIRFKIHFSIIGLLTALNGVFTIFAVPYTAGTLQALFGQAVIPLVMIMALIYLRTRFVIPQYVGAIVIFAGLFIELYPIIFGGSITGQTKPFWAAMFLVGQIPAAAASVYQEKAFMKARVNVIYMMAWANLAQFLFMVVLFPLNFIPHFGHVRFSESYTHYIDATKCLFNVLEGHHHTCYTALPWWFAAVGTMLLSGIFSALVVKHGSATLSVIVQTLVTPVAAFLFTFHFIMGSQTEHMTVYTWSSLLVLMLGVAVYRLPDVVNYPRLRAGVVYILTCGQCRIDWRASAAEAAEEDNDPQETTEEDTSPPDADTPTNGWFTYDFTARGLGMNAGDDPSSRPINLASRVGVVVSEYSAAKSDARTIFFEHTIPSGSLPDRLHQYASV